MASGMVCDLRKEKTVAGIDGLLRVQQTIADGVGKIVLSFERKCLRFSDGDGHWQGDGKREEVRLQFPANTGCGRLSCTGPEPANKQNP